MQALQVTRSARSSAVPLPPCLRDTAFRARTAQAARGKERRWSPAPRPSRDRTRAKSASRSTSLPTPDTIRERVGGHTSAHLVGTHAGHARDGEARHQRRPLHLLHRLLDIRTPRCLIRRYNEGSPKMSRGHDAHHGAARPPRCSARRNLRPGAGSNDSATGPHRDTGRGRQAGKPAQEVPRPR
jgi:hypothetical protein